jgi:hypothetical protein
MSNIHLRYYAKRGFFLQKNKNRMLYKWSFQQKRYGKFEEKND